METMLQTIFSISVYFFFFTDIPLQVLFHKIKRCLGKHLAQKYIQRRKEKNPEWTWMNKPVNKREKLGKWKQ